MKSPLPTDCTWWFSHRLRKSLHIGIVINIPVFPRRGCGKLQVPIKKTYPIFVLHWAHQQGDTYFPVLLKQEAIHYCAHFGAYWLVLIPLHRAMPYAIAWRPLAFIEGLFMLKITPIILIKKIIVQTINPRLSAVETSRKSALATPNRAECESKFSLSGNEAKEIRTLLDWNFNHWITVVWIVGIKSKLSPKKKIMSAIKGLLLIKISFRLFQYYIFHQIRLHKAINQKCWPFKTNKYLFISLWAINEKNWYIIIV